MEACVGAHHLSRKLKTLGHDARLMPAKYVRPYSKGQKNDFRDAEAIAEAVQRPTMKFVATKTADQLDLQALHRVRERLVSQRTGIINQTRAFLLERGIPVRQGQRVLRAELPVILATPPDVLSPRMVQVIEGLAGDWRRLDERIEYLSLEIETLARQDAGCGRLTSARSRATRCFCPPESTTSHWSRLSSSSTARSVARARSRAPGDLRSRPRPTSTFDRTSAHGSSRGSWNMTRATWGSLMRSPPSSNANVPCVGWSSPSRRRSKVLLPQPLRPRWQRTDRPARGDRRRAVAGGQSNAQNVYSAESKQ
jgi:hypothetical protein